MSCVALIQARMSSSRFPGKVLETIEDAPAIVYMARRVRLARRVDRVVVVTSTHGSDGALVDALESHGIECFRGSLIDVLQRYADAAAAFPAEHYVRLTGDCPLIDPIVVDAVVGALQASSADYASNVDPPTYPDGLDCECFTAAALTRCHHEATEAAEREHVTPWMRSARAGLRRINLGLPFDASGTRLTIDFPDDLEAVRRVLSLLPSGEPYDCYDLLRVIASHPEVSALNPHLRNEALLVAPVATAAEPME